MHLPCKHWEHIGRINYHHRSTSTTTDKHPSSIVHRIWMVTGRNFVLFFSSVFTTCRSLPTPLPCSGRRGTGRRRKCVSFCRWFIDRVHDLLWSSSKSNSIFRNVLCWMLRHGRFVSKNTQVRLTTSKFHLDAQDNWQQYSADPSARRIAHLKSYVPKHWTTKLSRTRMKQDEMEGTRNRESIVLASLAAASVELIRELITSFIFPSIPFFLCSLPFLSWVARGF